MTREPDITRPHGQPQLTPAQMEELAQHVDGASAQSLYSARYERHFRGKGHPQTYAHQLAEYWAALKVNPTPGVEVIDPDLTVDDLLDRYRAERVARGESSAIAAVDPAARPGIRASAASYGASTPPAIMDRPRNTWLTGSFEIDRFSLNPGRDSVLQQLNERDLVGPAPEMFVTGPLPRFTASGIDPAELRWCAWQLRTSAAFCDDRAQVLQMIMASSEPMLDETLQTSLGRDMLNDYFVRIATWANTVPEGADLQSVTPAEASALYPDGSDSGQ
jgi:hypothetical protein